MYIGTVVAEVNGQPIYADKILTKVDTELSAKAPILEPREFKLALDEVGPALANAQRSRHPEVRAWATAELARPSGPK